MKKLLKWIAFSFIGLLVLGFIIESTRSPEQKAADLVSVQKAKSDSTHVKAFDLSEQGIQALDKNIVKVEVTPQIDGSTNLIEVQVNRTPFTGGKNDWNGIAVDSHRFMSKLLKQPEVSRIRVSYVSPENDKLDWAHIAVAKSDLPSDWESLSYLQFFGQTQPQAGTVETARWLCDFYRAYKSAQPVSGLPRNCKA